MKRILVYRKTGRPVKRGDVVEVRDNGPSGEGKVDAIVEDWHLPHTPQSTGRVVLRIGTELQHPYYPSVIDAEWRDAIAGYTPPQANRITEVKLTLDDVGDWLVEVTKTFAPEHGGGSQVFSEFAGPDVHRALDVARSMVTLTPGQRTNYPKGDGGSR